MPYALSPECSQFPFAFAFAAFAFAFDTFASPSLSSTDNAHGASWSAGVGEDHISLLYLANLATHMGAILRYFL